MEICTKTKSGIPVRLAIGLDKYSVHQIFATIGPLGNTTEDRRLCDGWRVRKTEQGIEEGIIAGGLLIQVPRSVWESMLLLREDLRDKENLKEIHLVRIFSRGNLLTIDAYALSAKVDRDTWEKIEPFMRRVDSSANDEILSGDHYIGWVVKEGMEREVELTLGIEGERSNFALAQDDGADSN